MPFADELTEYIIRSVNALATQVNDARLAESPFSNGVLAPSSGGTGVANSDSFTLTLLADTTLSGNPAAAVHTHAAADITSGTLATARLGSGSAVATTLLHGDSTWSVVDILAETTGTLTIARGGTGATSAGAALTALGAAAASHAHAGADITSGTVAAARLGSGTPSATTLLWGDSSWAALVATDLPTHASRHNDGGADEVALNTSQITAGTMATARLGSGTANSTTFLRGDQTWAAPAGGVDGSGAANRVAFWTDADTISSDAGMTYDAATNDLTIVGDFVAATIDTEGLQWRFSSFTSAGDAASNGYLTVVVNGTSYRLNTRA